jgi:hypothetical protein
LCKRYKNGLSGSSNNAAVCFLFLFLFMVVTQPPQTHDARRDIRHSNRVDLLDYKPFKRGLILYLLNRQ